MSTIRGNSCLTCRHYKRADIERALSSGAFSLRSVARSWNIDPESLRRHVQNHLAPVIREAMRGTPGLSAASIAERMLDAADAAHQIRADAMAAGKDSIALRAVDAEVRSLAVIADRLGITQDDARDELALAHDLLIAVAKASRDNTDLGELLAAELLALDRTYDADDLLGITNQKEISA